MFEPRDSEIKNIVEQPSCNIKHEKTVWSWRGEMLVTSYWEVLWIGFSCLLTHTFFAWKERASFEQEYTCADCFFLLLFLEKSKILIQGKP